MNSFTLTLISHFGGSLTNATDTNNDSTSTQERSIGLLHDNLPAKDAII